MFKPINLGSNSHTPPLPREEHIIGDGFAPLDTDQFGLHHLYNVARSNDVTASILELLEEPEKIALQQYQAWTELGWKTQHGTEASLERFAAKLNEECGELQEATLNYFENPDSESDRQELISEAGDVMWLTWALASNAGVSMEAALKQLTNRYVHGIRWVRPGPEDVEPTWRDAAIAFATKFDHLRIADFDAMIAAGFEPTVSTHMNIYEDFDYELPEDILRDIDYLTKLLVRSVGQQYGKTESSDQDPQLVLTSQEFARRGEAVGELASRVTLLAAHFLWRIAGVLPSQIFTHNIKKVSGRVSSGLVDKTDGERPAELK